MRLFIENKEREVKQVTASRIHKILDNGYCFDDSLSPEQKSLYGREPIILYGRSGIGKSGVIKQWAKKHNLKMLEISLAMFTPEMIGGIPQVDMSTSEGRAKVYELVLPKILEPVIKDKGEGWVIFIDEANQGMAEVLNTMYSICYPDPNGRNWNGNPMPYVQVVLAGNLDDGSDGNVYLTALPTPLHNRLKVYEMVYDRKEAVAFLTANWKPMVPNVDKYLKVIFDDDVSPRGAEMLLKELAKPETLLERLADRMSEPAARELLEIKNNRKVKDPAESLKVARAIYAEFKTHGGIKINDEVITDEETLLDKFREKGLNDEEIASIVKGGE